MDLAHANALSTPIGAPLVASFPFSFRNVDVLTLAYRTSLDAAKALLPEPLLLKSDWVLIHLYNMNDVDWLGKYGECNVMIDAELPGKATGGYSPFLFLNSDGGLAQGREVHGQPKKWGNPRVEFRGDLIVGVLERNGIDVVTGTMAYKQTRGDLEELKQRTFDFTSNLNYKIQPQIDSSPAVRQITSRKLSDVVVHECWSGSASIELRPNVQAPLYRLPVVEVLKAWYWRADFTLVKGETLFEFPR